MTKTSVKEFRLVNVDLLVPYANNARTHSKEQIKKLQSSLREFGFINPLIIDRQYNVLAGHGRLEAAKAERYTEVPCVFVEDLTEAQKKAYILADNRMALDAGWDEELLAVELGGLSDLDFDLSLTGFDDKELAAFFKSDEAEIEDDDYDLTKALEKAAFVEYGDRWIVGRHVLVCGDATNPDDVKKLMEGKRANLLLTDPPYGVSFTSSSGLKIKNDSLKNEEFYNFLLKAFKNMVDHCEPGASAYCFHADTEGLNFRKAFSEAGFYLSGTCIWKKQSLVLGRSPYQWQHEPVLFGWKKSGKHNWYADRKQTTIWEFEKPKKNADHPTMKPVALVAYPILNSSLSNCIVLDPFGGSGSTLIACEQTDRICYTIELDEKYCDVIVKRYIEQVGSSDGVYLLRDNSEIRYGDLPGVSADEA